MIAIILALIGIIVKHEIKAPKRDTKSVLASVDQHLIREPAMETLTQVRHCHQYWASVSKAKHIFH